MNKNGTMLPVEIPTICLPTVAIPATNACPSGLSVIPDPTRVFDLNVAIPATSKIPVLRLQCFQFQSTLNHHTKLEAVTTPAVTLIQMHRVLLAVPL